MCIRDRTSDGYGVCSDEDYEEDYHGGVAEEYADGFPPYQWHFRYAHSAKDVFEWFASHNRYPNFGANTWDYDPYEGIQSMDVALGETFFWHTFCILHHDVTSSL